MEIHRILSFSTKTKYREISDLRKLMKDIYLLLQQVVHGKIFSVNMALNQQLIYQSISTLTWNLSGIFDELSNKGYEEKVFIALLT